MGCNESIYNYLTKTTLEHYEINNNNNIYNALFHVEPRFLK